MSVKTLENLRPGEEGWIIDLCLEERMKRRLQDIGLVEGTKVLCVYKSPLGDPAAYRIRGAVIAIRNGDSEKIIVEAENEMEEEHGIKQKSNGSGCNRLRTENKKIKK